MVPWNNGAGTTLDIALSDSDQPFWRLSLAQMSTNAPFSLFKGLSRILTVVKGCGLTLSSPTLEITAPFETPVTFSGDDTITGLLHNGAVENFNLVYDGAAFSATATILQPQGSLDMPPKSICAIYLLAGSAVLNGTTAITGDVLLSQNKAAHITFKDNARILLVTLQETAC